MNNTNNTTTLTSDIDIWSVSGSVVGGGEEASPRRMFCSTERADATPTLLVHGAPPPNLRWLDADLRLIDSSGNVVLRYARGASETDATTLATSVHPATIISNFYKMTDFVGKSIPPLDAAPGSAAKLVCSSPEGAGAAGSVHHHHTVLMVPVRSSAEVPLVRKALDTLGSSDDAVDIMLFGPEAAVAAAAGPSEEVPPPDTLRFGDVVLDAGYRDMLYRRFPELTAGAIMDCCANGMATPPIPSHADWLLRSGSQERKTAVSSYDTAEDLHLALIDRFGSCAPATMPTVARTVRVPSALVTQPNLVVSGGKWNISASCPADSSVCVQPTEIAMALVETVSVQGVSSRRSLPTHLEPLGALLRQILRVHDRHSAADVLLASHPAAEAVVCKTSFECAFRDLVRNALSALRRAYPYCGDDSMLGESPPYARSPDVRPPLLPRNVTVGAPS